MGPRLSVARVADEAAADPAAEAVRLDGVSVTFQPRGANARPYTAVSELSLRVADGEFVSVVGPTGCGKSTILNLVAGLLAPTVGQVRIFGSPLKGINRQAGYLFQADAIMPWRTAIENVAAGLEIQGVAADERRRQAREWLGRVGLRGKDDFYPHQLSGGMRRRVALAQMLIVDPKILLMDEPFSALDIQTRQLMENELLELWNADRKSVLFITHDLEEAISMSDRVVLLSAGPATHPIGEYVIDLPRPRDVAEIRLTPRFLELHSTIWRAMREEVLKGYERNERS
jgi:NitT/TauT family transport system ATP-binding protein